MSKKSFLILLIFVFIISVKYTFSQSDFYNSTSVREVRIYFKEGNWDYLLDSLHEYVGEDGRLLGDVKIEGKLLKNVGVRYKGYSSFNPNAVKSPFNIDLEYNFNNQNYEGYTKLKLSNVIQDPSFIREVLTYDIARKYVPVSNANFANVYVNDTLLGLYTNVEAVDKNFVDLRFGSRNHTFFKGAPENLIIPDGQNANLAYTHGTDTTGYKPFYKLESDNSETSWTDLLSLIYALNNDTANIPAVLNIDRALWMHAINYSVVNLDSYIGYSQNYYLYMDDNGRFNPILWDFNMSFGSFKETDGITAPPGGLTIAKRKTLNPLKMLTSTPLSPRPFIVSLLQNPTYKRMFLAHIRTILNENFKNNYYYTRGQELQDLIDIYVQNDSNKFYPYAQFRLNLDTTVGSGNNIFPGIKDFMQARLAYLDTFPGISGFPIISDILPSALQPDIYSSITINTKVSGANSVFLKYRFASSAVFSTTQMFDDGQHNDALAGDSIYGAILNFSGEIFQYYIYAENQTAGAFMPERAEYEFYTIYPKVKKGNFVINEMMTSSHFIGNTMIAANWIEFINTGKEKLNLKNLCLTNIAVNNCVWSFPDTLINPAQYLIIFSNNSASDSYFLAPLDLNSEGGKIYLGYDGESYIDSLIYPNQIEHKSYGRYPNAYGDFKFLTPTYNAYNKYNSVSSNSIVIYPNPSNTNVYIENNTGEIPIKYEIYDAIGKKVGEWNINNSSEKGKSTIFELNVSQFNKGIYHVKISYTNNIVSKSIVIN